MKMTLKQGDLENIILNALWDLENEGHSKIFVGDIQQKIKTSRPDAKAWAYTTVKTVLDRLVDKEIASRQKEGKKYLYFSVLKRGEAGVTALSKLIRQYFQNDIESLEACLETVRPQFAGKAYATAPQSNLKQPAKSTSNKQAELVR